MTKIYYKEIELLKREYKVINNKKKIYTFKCFYL